MNIIIKRISELVKRIFTFEEVVGNVQLESLYENNIIRGGYYLRNSSKYILGIETSDGCNSYEDAQMFNNSIVNSLKELCVSIGLLKLKGDLDVENILPKLDNFFSFYLGFPDIFDKDEFRWIPYLNYNKDLLSHDITSFDKVCKHWEEYGINEKRIINGPLGINTSRGIVSRPYLNSLHYIAKIKSLLGSRIKNAIIYDINGGIGVTTYYLKKMGVKKIFLVNKPEYCLVSSYYLSSVLYPDDVTLYKEGTNNNVVILPIYNYISLLNNVHYFLVCEEENLRIISKNEFDPRNFDKRFFLISF